MKPELSATTRRPLLRPRRCPKERRCNLCSEEFLPKTVFDRFCSGCRQESELLRFCEWLPEIAPELTERLTA